MWMFNDISCDKKDNEEECLANAEVVSALAKKFGIGQWSFIDPGSEKKWYSMEENSPQGRNAVFPVRSKAKDMKNCQYISLQII